MASSENSLGSGFPMAPADRTVRWGVMSTARISAKVAAAIKAAQGAELLSIGSRSTGRAAQWAKLHGAARIYGSYDELLDDDEIDAVYIPLPPALHHIWTIKAAEKGKHVLCEKPLSVTVEDAREMVAACEQNHVQLMDGVMWTHHPRAADMFVPIKDGTLGKVRRATSAFTFNWDEVPEEDIRLQRELGGGSLLDLGWYCVRATLWAFDDLPERVFGTARWYRDIDMNFSGMMWFSDDRMASFDCGFDVGMRKWFEVAGTRASLVCDDFVKPWDEARPRFWLHNASGKMEERVSSGVLQEVRMIEDFCAIVRSGQLDNRWPSASLATQIVCNALEQSARVGRAVELHG